MKTKTLKVLHLRMNHLLFRSTSIYLFYLLRKLVLDKIMLSPFSDLKELIFRKRYKTETKPIFRDRFYQKKKKKKKKRTTEVYNSRIMKRSSSQYHAFFDFYIINPSSMDSVLLEL